MMKAWIYENPVRRLTGFRPSGRVRRGPLNRIRARSQSSLGLGELAELGEDRALGTDAHERPHDLALVVEVHCRKTRDAVLRGRDRVGIGIHLDDRQLLALLVGDLLEDRRELTARAAPGSPEVDQHGAVSLEHLLIEVGVGDGGDVCHVCNSFRSLLSSTSGVRDYSVSAAAGAGAPAWSSS